MNGDDALPPRNNATFDEGSFLLPEVAGALAAMEASVDALGALDLRTLDGRAAAEIAAGLAALTSRMAVVRVRLLR